MRKMDVITDSMVVELKDLFENLTKCPKNITPSSDAQIGDNKESHLQNWEDSINSIITKIDEFLSSVQNESEEFLKLLSMKASIIYEKAKIYLTNELLEKSQQMLLNALNIIEHYSKNPKISFLYLRIVNHLAYSLSRRGECEKARELLEKVTEEELEETPLVYSTEDLFNNIESEQSQAEYKLNKLMINNMQMLGWVYGKLGLYDSHTSMQHRSLQKQIEIDDGEPLQWAIKCSRLASLFLTQCQWVHARYHLSSAQTILDQLEIRDVPNAELVKAQADLSKCCINYALHLFSVSKKAIMESLYCENSSSAYTDKVPPGEEDLPDSFKFTGLEVRELPIPAVQICSTIQARALFQQSHKWIKRVQLFYNLRDFPLEYVNAILDLSELYKFLTFYEPDIDAQYNVQKKRSDALENLCTILKEVRPSCYMAVSIELLRELSEVQIELMAINLRRIYNVENMTITEESLRKRMTAVKGIHKKLETVGDMMGNTEIVTVYENQVRKNEFPCQSQVEEQMNETEGSMTEVEVDGEENA